MKLTLIKNITAYYCYQLLDTIIILLVFYRYVEKLTVNYYFQVRILSFVSNLYSLVVLISSGGKLYIHFIHWIELTYHYILFEIVFFQSFDIYSTYFYLTYVILILINYLCRCNYYFVLVEFIRKYFG